MIKVNINLDRLPKDIKDDISKKLLPLFVGVNTKKRRVSKSKVTTLGKGPALKKGTKISKGYSNLQLANKFEEQVGVFTKPFESKKGKDLVIDYFVKAYKQGLKNAPLNSIRSVVTQPLLLGKYGNYNRRVSGSNFRFRKIVQTGQFYSSITAFNKYNKVPKN